MPHTNRTGESGFTMIEVVIAALLIALIIGALGFDLIGSANFSGDQRVRSQADEVAQQDLERLKGLSSLQLAAANGQQRQVTLGATTFTVTTTTQSLSSSGHTSCGSSGVGAAAYFRAASSVNWPGNRQTPVAEETLITPPAGGVLLTQVQDENGAPVSGVSVGASGADTANASTDANGCTVMAGLAPGAYTLTLTRPGYVDTNGDLSPITLPATVADTGTSTPAGGNPVSFAPAGDVQAQFSTAGASPSTGQLADAISWIGGGATQRMASVKTTSPVTPAALLPAGGPLTLYPFSFAGPSFTGNYQIWAGSCPQMQPPTGSSNTFTVAPGSTQKVTVPEPGINLTVTYNGSRVTPADVRFYFKSTSGPSCSDSWSAPIASNAATSATGVLADPGQPFASTATSGATESASSYTGSYSICADYGSGGYNGRAATTVTGITNTSFTSLTPVTINLSSSSYSRSGSCP